MNTRLDFLPTDFLVRKCNHMVMEWSKLYSNENNEHLPYEDFLALNENALTIPVTEWLYLGRNQPLIPRQNQIPGKHFAEAQSDDHQSKKQRVNPATSTAGGGERGGQWRREVRQEKAAAGIQHGAEDNKADSTTSAKADTGGLYQERSTPGDCTIATCTRKHNALQSNGKLSKPDKEAVRSYIDGMTPGPYADKCKITFDTHL